MKIQKVIRSRGFMIVVLSVACAVLAISWPQWRDALQASEGYGVPGAGNNEIVTPPPTPCGIPGDSACAE